MLATSAPPWVELALCNSDKLFMVDEADVPLLMPYRWYLTWAGTVNGYRPRPNSQTAWVIVSRLLLGVTDGTVLVDHISGDPLDNRRSNLRRVTDSQNNQNARIHRDNVSGFKGVSPARGGRWRANICHNRKVRTLGHTATAEEAARLYDAAARELHGEFARVNFPLPGEQAARGFR
jgi:hypothetical protein